MVEDPLVASDYRYAVIQAVCLLHEGEYHLVFASAELLPAELPRPPDEPGASNRAKRLDSKAMVFHRRYVVSADEALIWYGQCRQGRFTLLADDAGHPTQHLPLVQEPAWPQLITGSKFPVWGDVPSSTRAHHLFPATSPPLVEKLFQLHPEIEQWVSDRIFASFMRFPELAGSIHLLAPNPVYRDLKVRLHVADDGSESSVIELTPRPGLSAHGLEALVFEHRPTGVSSLQTQSFGERPYMMVPYQGAVEETEIFIRCPRRGLLEWQPPSGFVRAIGLTGSLVSTRKKVIVPQKPGDPDQSYEISMVDRGWSSEYQSARGPTAIPARLRFSESERRRNDEAERLGQKWFHRSRQDATEFVRGLIGEARERVWIVDPYFATVELFSFALATTRSEVEVKILTGAEALQKKEVIEPSTEAGDILSKNMQGRSDMAHIEVLVMTGDVPTVHDRFLVIDQKVWFTGNSLNSLGDRAGMMISLPAPGVVISNLQAIMSDQERTKPLAEWVVQRQANRTT